jgi:hypothetical protein
MLDEAKKKVCEQIENLLTSLLCELVAQPEIASTYLPDKLSYVDEMAQLKEFIDVGEYGVAYESMVATLELYPFKITGPGAVKLLELGLFMGFKTERDEDRAFDRRNSANDKY